MEICLRNLSSDRESPHSQSWPTLGCLWSRKTGLEWALCLPSLLPFNLPPGRMAGFLLLTEAPTVN